ncbi:MAG: hypothetical protein L0Z63_08750 [Actinobacteria bacterium]|nr:hypothetical protein [Actinomycetota bacterium]
MGRSLPHLAHRFFEVLRAKPLDAEEEALAKSWLDDGLWALFTGQQTADQRHGFHAGAKLRNVGRPDLAVAAMLHDVGKTASRLGVIGRSVATVLMTLRAPMSPRMRMYRDHGELGARTLETAGAPTIAVAFAQHHQGERPAEIPDSDWALLIWADEPGMPERVPGG